MARINLLPWREERRRQRQQEFYAVLGGAALMGLVAFVGVNMQLGAMQGHQDGRNQILRNQIAVLDRRIRDIEALEQERAELVERKLAIEELQKSRTEIVRLFDQIVRTIPDGVSLESVKQAGPRVTLEGLAESNAKVSAYMRSLEGSPWMRNADLNITEAEGDGRRSLYKFKVEVQVGPEPQTDDSQDQGVAG
ncbi:MAG: PilN domain-containing protein [Pseudomonadota bacterium]